MRRRHSRRRNFTRRGRRYSTGRRRGRRSGFRGRTGKPFQVIGYRF